MALHERFWVKTYTCSVSVGISEHAACDDKDIRQFVQLGQNANNAYMPYFPMQKLRKPDSVSQATRYDLGRNVHGGIRSFRSDTSILQNIQTCQVQNERAYTRSADLNQDVGDAMRMAGWRFP